MHFLGKDPYPSPFPCSDYDHRHEWNHDWDLGLPQTTGYSKHRANKCSLAKRGTSSTRLLSHHGYCAWKHPNLLTHSYLKTGSLYNVEREQFLRRWYYPNFSHEYTQLFSHIQSILWSPPQPFQSILHVQKIGPRPGLKPAKLQDCYENLKLLFESHLEWETISQVHLMRLTVASGCC